MRIAFLLPAEYAIGNPGNGVTAQARAQAAALARRGHDVVYLSPWDFQQEEQIDVLHFFMGGMALIGIECGRRLATGGALVMSPIMDTNRPQFMYRLAARAGSLIGPMRTVPAILSSQARGSDVVVCRSRYEQRRAIRSLGVCQTRTGVVLNGIDPPDVSRDAMHAVAQRYGLPERFILHVSNYTDPRKNVLRLAAAADQLGLPLVIAGHSMPGPVANELAAYARRNDRMRVLGFVDRGTRDALYALCHVFCLPSHHEGTGLAALEAGAAGAHVVITRLGGTRDYFKDLALYVSPTNDHEIRSMLAKAWDTPRDTKLKNHIRANLSWDTSACALEQAYETARARKAKV